MKLRILKLALCLACASGIYLLMPREGRPFTASAQNVDRGPTQSGPIAISPDDKFIWVANPDNDSVSVLRVEGDANLKLAEIAVGDEPQNVAIAPDGRHVYVSNTVSGTVSVISTATQEIVATVLAGTEPYGMAFTPNGTKLYVANARSNDISVIDPNRNVLVATIRNIGLEPRGLAVTSDGDLDDRDEKLYATQFYAIDRPNTVIGADDYKEGRVTVISTATDTVVGEVILNPVADTGFNSNGSALGRIAPTNPPTFTFKTGAFPNNLNSIAIKGTRAYVPNNAASPDGPFRFNVNVQSFLSVIDTANDQEGVVGGVSQTINMNRGINFEPPSPNKVFLAMPWHIAFENNSNEGWMVSSGSNVLVKVVLDANGTPTVNAPKAANDPGNLVRLLVGQNPRGVVINSTDTRAYVMNEVSRDVSVVNLTSERVIATISAAALPAPGTQAAKVQYGKAIFFSSAGVNLPSLGPVIPVGRLSNEGWSGCVSCHAFGLTDAVVWIFDTGPRRSLPLNGTFNPHNPSDQKILNYSAVRDEVADFEANIRNVQGGLGLITLADGVTPDPVLNNFNPPNAGRSVALDALTEFIARGIRTPISPLRGASRFSREGRLIALGRQLFEDVGCVNCHSGGGWSTFRVDFAPPPTGDANAIVNAQFIRHLRQVGTFDPTAFNEIRQNLQPPLGADGFAAPSLLGAFALGPLFHNGSAVTIDDLLNNIEHRRAGLGPFQVDPLNRAINREALTTFLKSIDAQTPPF